MAHICTAPNFYPTIGALDIHKAGLKVFPFTSFIAPSKANCRAYCRTPTPPTCLLVGAFSEMMTLLTFSRIAQYFIAIAQVEMCGCKT